jgi:hypothetical protein
VTDVAVVGFAQTPCARRSDSTTSGVEMLVPIFGEVLGRPVWSGDIGFWCLVLDHPPRGLFGPAVTRLAFAGDGVAREMDAAGRCTRRGWSSPARPDRAGHGSASRGRLRRVPRPAGPRAPAGRVRARQGPRRTGRDWTLRPQGPRPGATRGRRSPASTLPRTCWPRRTWPSRCGHTTARRSATARPWPSWPPGTGPASCARGRPGSPGSSTGSTQAYSAPAT